MTSYEYFYPGTPSSLESEYSNLFSGYSVPAGRLGATTSIRTANQLKEVSNLLNQGINNVEVSVIDKQVFDQIPREHMKEIARLQKLTGSNITLHAPIVEPSGFNQQGTWSEEDRLNTEREVIDVLERGHELNHKGNIPVTIHSSAQIPASSYLMEKNPLTGKMEKVQDTIIAYNRAEGRLVPMKREVDYPLSGVQGPGGSRMYAEGRVRSAESKLRDANASFWDNQINELLIQKEKGDELVEDASRFMKLVGEKGANHPAVVNAREKLFVAKAYYENIHKSLDSLYRNAVKAVKESHNEEGVKKFREIAQNFEKNTRRIGEAKNEVESLFYNGAALGGLLKEMKKFTEPHLEVEINGKRGLAENPFMPKLFVPVEEFALDQSSKTLSNAAFAAYELYKEKAPVISIENPPYGQALSTGHELKSLVGATREKFIGRLMKEKKLSEKKANEVAEKLIGVTWDTAHISAMRKKGFTNKDIVKEARAVAGILKTVQINDSLGGQAFGDLPPGMGDQPIAQVMQEFENKGFAGPVTFEGGAFFAQHQISPHPFVLESLGSGIYPAKAGPGWNRGVGAGNEPIYYSGMGTTLPDYNFQMYGAGFTNLPTDFGGQRAGAGSRFSGTPMA